MRNVRFPVATVINDCINTATVHSHLCVTYTYTIFVGNTLQYLSLSCTELEYSLTILEAACPRVLEGVILDQFLRLASDRGS